MEPMNWIEAAGRSDCGVAFRREGTTLYFVHPERGMHLGLQEDGFFLQMRFRESLLKTGLDAPDSHLRRRPETLPGHVRRYP